MTNRVLRCVLALVILLGLATGASRAQDLAKAKKAIVEDKVVAGSPKDFMEARYLLLKGTNEEIGMALALIAKERFATKLVPSPDPLRARVQRRFIEKNYPILFDRMRGVAGAFGGKLDDDSQNFTGLHYPNFIGASSGCSVMYFPPSVTSTKKGIISRDYDFTTGTFRGTKPKDGELPCTSRPYILEMYPERGYASIALCSYDLLSGVLDGMNSEGLTVALLADDELASKFKMEPSGFDTAGLGALQMQRMLLDTCANVNEAKEALLSTKQYYEAIPVHYIVADRHGNAFVWEYSHAHNKEYIIENPGKPLVTTNFSLHRYLDNKKPPSPEAVKKVCPRYCKLCDKLAGNSEKLTLDFIKETHKLVDAVGNPPKTTQRALGRTLWHTIYVPEDGTMQVSFYLRDEPNPDDPARPRIVRSDYLNFTLKNAKTNK